MQPECIFFKPLYPCQAVRIISKVRTKKASTLPSLRQLQVWVRTVPNWILGIVRCEGRGEKKRRGGWYASALSMLSSHLFPFSSYIYLLYMLGHKWGNKVWVVSGYKWPAYKNFWGDGERVGDVVVPRGRGEKHTLYFVIICDKAPFLSLAKHSLSSGV